MGVDMMRPKTYRLVEMAVQEGVDYGYGRAFKYSDKPSDSAIKEEILQAVMTQICEWFDFDENNS